MDDRLTPEQIAELERLEATATPAPWRLRHCDIGYSGRTPEPGLNSSSGLGWDWDWDNPDVNTPPQPMRGIFELGADAGLVMGLRNAAPALIAAARENEKLRKALQSVKVMQIGERVFIGVIAADGCWSAEMGDEGHQIALAWEESRRAALGDAP